MSVRLSPRPAARPPIAAVIKGVTYVFFPVKKKHPLLWKNFPRKIRQRPVKNVVTYVSFREKFPPSEIYASGGGLIVASVNASRLLLYNILIRATESRKTIVANITVVLKRFIQLVRSIM